MTPQLLDYHAKAISKYYKQFGVDAVKANLDSTEINSVKDRHFIEIKSNAEVLLATYEISGGKFAFVSPREYFLICMPELMKALDIRQSVDIPFTTEEINQINRLCRHKS